MALWTEFFRAQRLAEQGARARGREGLSTGENMATMQPIYDLAASEEAGKASSQRREIAREILQSENKRFGDRLGLGRERLALEKTSAETGADIGRRRLGLGMDEYKHMRSMRPWSIGLGAGTVALSGYERFEQNKRDREYRDAVYEILGLGKRRRSPLSPNLEGWIDYERAMNGRRRGD